MTVMAATDGMEQYEGLLTKDPVKIRLALRKHPDVLILRKECFGRYKVFFKTSGGLGELSVIDFYDSAKGSIGKAFDVFMEHLTGFTGFNKMPTDRAQQFIQELEKLMDDFLTAKIGTSKLLRLIRIKAEEFDVDADYFTGIFDRYGSSSLLYVLNRKAPEYLYEEA